MDEKQEMDEQFQQSTVFSSDLLNASFTVKVGRFLLAEIKTELKNVEHGELLYTILKKRGLGKKSDFTDSEAKAALRYLMKKTKIETEIIDVWNKTHLKNPAFAAREGKKLGKFLITKFGNTIRNEKGNKAGNQLAAILDILIGAAITFNEHLNLGKVDINSKRIAYFFLTIITEFLDLLAANGTLEDIVNHSGLLPEESSNGQEEQSGKKAPGRDNTGQQSPGAANQTAQQANTQQSREQAELEAKEKAAGKKAEELKKQYRQAEKKLASRFNYLLKSMNDLYKDDRSGMEMMDSEIRNMRDYLKKMDDLLE